MHFRACFPILLSALLWTASVLAAKPAVDEFVAPLQATAAARSTPRASDRARAIRDELTGKPA